MQVDQRRGEVKAPASAIHLMHQFVRKVISAIKQVLTRICSYRTVERVQSVGKDLRKDLESFLLQPRMSRIIPGKSVSVQRMRNTQFM